MFAYEKIDPADGGTILMRRPIYGYLEDIQMYDFEDKKWKDYEDLGIPRDEYVGLCISYIDLEEEPHEQISEKEAFKLIGAN